MGATDSAGHARPDLLAGAAASLRALGAGRLDPGRRAGGARRRRDAVRQRRLGDGGPPARGRAASATLRIPSSTPKVYEGLHIAAAFERAADFDLLHNHFDFLPLTYSRLVSTPLVTTIHGFSSERILPVFRAYNDAGHYVAISDADRHPDLTYAATIHHGIPLAEFTFRARARRLPALLRPDPPGQGRSGGGRARPPDRSATDAGRHRPGSRLLRALGRAVPDGDRIRFVGSVGPTERDALLGGARGLLHLINFDEPFGLSVVEALATGTPTIAYRRGSMPELIEPDRSGFLVDDLDAAERATAVADRVDRRVCRADAEAHFSAERMVDDYLALYRAAFSAAEPVERVLGRPELLAGRRPRCTGGRATIQAARAKRSWAGSAGAGFRYLRFFLLWEAFQPEPELGECRARCATSSASPTLPRGLACDSSRRSSRAT